MKFLILILLHLSIFCVGNSVQANSNDLKINNPEELNTFCKNKSIQYFEGKNKTAHSWTSQWRIENGVMDVKGIWKVDEIEYVVMCRIKQGMNEHMMIISIEQSKQAK